MIREPQQQVSSNSNAGHYSSPDIIINILDGSNYSSSNSINRFSRSSDSQYVSTAIEPKNKADGRLFPDTLLYCEGENRPLLRGKLHLLCSLILPMGAWHLYNEANGVTLGQFAGVFYVFTNLMSYGSSAVYHVGRWSVQKEIALQKLDHCCIALLSAGTMAPLALLLLPPLIGWSFAFFLAMLLLWNIYNICNCRPSVWRQAMVPMMILPYLPYCYIYMSSTEWICTMGCILFQICGVFVFVNKKGNFVDNVFGYHELFHIMVVAAGVCVYIANWSIIRRTCNPYAHHIEVVDVLKIGLHHMNKEIINMFS